ncbi:MAG: energy-coupling factor transporter ATPase [Clostridia bacterium]|nr:energy-coupling factor transporter ATPase [Clostridia bacterium]
MTAAELKNVSYIYSQNTPFMKVAVDNINITFEENMTIGLIGHTGSGKSTVAQMLNGILRPTSGDVIIRGKNMWESPKKLKEFRYLTGLVFQYPEYQLFEETVYKDIAFGPKNMGLAEEAIERRVREAARFVGLSDSILEKSPFDISGGQKRRVAIAGVIAMNPKNLVLDEPAAGLDPRGRDEILGRIREYQQQTHSTVIMISHSMEDMALYCDKLVVMHESKPIMAGTCEEVFSRAEELEKAGLSVPQVTKLMMELANMGYDVNTSVYTIEEAKKELLRVLGGEVKC